MPENIIELIAAAEAAWRALPESYRRAGSAFSRADPYVLYSELRRLPRSGLRFLEWGSGVGVITLMADLLGLEAVGIEFDARLVEAARSLAASLNSKARFAIGSFLPPGCGAVPRIEEDGLDEGDAEQYLMEGGPSGYLELGQTAADFDLIYAYPAPDHVDWFVELFRQFARAGARLWLYTETTGILTCVKIDGERCTSLVPA